MQIGDKVLVTYSDDTQRAGRIVGETAKMWKIEFDESGETKRVMKTQDIVLVDDPTTPEPEVITVDTDKVVGWLTKFWNWITGLFKKK
jgi:RNase P/RNase MRP subunit p29